MELSRFERVIWRTNAPLILLCCLAALGLMSIVSYRLLQDIFRARPTNSVVNVNAETHERESLQLGRFVRVAGTELLAAPLIASQEYRQSYYSKTGSTTRNYLFLHSKTKAAHWLLQNNSSLILDDHNLLLDPSVNGSERTVRSVIYEVVKVDSDGDSRLTAADQLTLVHYRIGGSEPVELFSITGKVLGVDQLSANEATIVYEDGTGHFVATLDEAAAKLVGKTQLPAFQ